MTQASFISSGLSLDDENIDSFINNGIRVLLEQFFDQMKPFQEAGDPISALLSASEKQQTVFRERSTEILHASVESLLRYAMFQNISPISLKQSNIEMHSLSKQFIKLLSGIILIYPMNKLSLFFNNFLNALFNIIHSNDFIFPNAIDDNTVVTFEEYKNIRIQTIEIYLQIIIKIISQIPNDNKNLLEIMHECLFKFDDQPTIQYLALKCLSRSFPFSSSNSLIQIRLIINFMLNMNTPINRNNQNEATYLYNLSIFNNNLFHKSDKYATLALKNALSSFPKNMLPLFGREVLGYIVSMSKYKDFMIINEIFNILKIYLEADHANYRQLGSIFVKLFEEFFRNEIFIGICKRISFYNNLFDKQLIRTYIIKGNPEKIPYLMQINSRLLIEYSELLDSVYLRPGKKNSFFYENIPCSIFYQICSTLAKESNADQLGLTNEMIEYLEKQINTDELPAPSLVSPLMRFVPNTLMQHLPEYDLDTTYNAIFTNKTHLTDEIKNILIRKAQSTKPFPLIPYFIIAYPSQNIEENSQFDEFLKKAANPQLDSKSQSGYSAYEHKIFIDALAKRFQNNVDKILPENIVLTLLKKKMFKSAIYIGYNKTTFPLFYKQFFHILKTVSGPCAQAAFFTLKNISKNVLNSNINMNKFAFLGELFQIITSNDNEPNLVSLNSREDRVKAVILYLLASPSIISRPPDNLVNISNLSDARKSLGYLLKVLKDNILPVLIRNKDEDSINKFTEIVYKQNSLKDFTLDYNSDEFIKYRNDLVKSTLLDTFTYLLAYCERSVTHSSLMFLMNLTGHKPYDFVRQYSLKLTTNLLLYLGHPKREIRNQTKLGISIIATASESEKIKDQNEVIKKFWQKNFLNTIHSFSYILNKKSDLSKKMVLESLYNGLESLAPILHKFYPKITSLIDLAIKDPDLTKKCLLFWQKFLNIVKNSHETIEHLFGQIITQVLPYLNEYKELVKSILQFFIVDNFQITHLHFPEIAHIPIFYEQYELKDFTDILVNEIQKVNWKDQIKILVNQLEQASPTFRMQLLTQILKFMKEHIDEIANDKTINNNDKISQVLLRSLWDNISHETNQELISLSGRCMSLLPYIKETDSRNAKEKERKERKENKNKNKEEDKNEKKVEIIICMIKDYLIKVLEDSSNMTYHDHAAFAIQELLKHLMNIQVTNDNEVTPSIKSSVGQNKKTEGEIARTGNLMKIPENIWNVIEPFVHSKFSYPNIKPLEENYTLVAPKASDFNVWLSLWTSRMFSVSLQKKDNATTDSSIFYCCECVLGDSPGLIKYILPYLISFNSKNEFFLRSLREEWQGFYSTLKSKNKPSREIIKAKNAMRLFFQLFDVLNKWRIAVGSVHNRGEKWISLNIATDEVLADAAFECELYLRALYHIEFHINETKTLKENYPFLYKIYQNIDDSDMKKVISKDIMDRNLSNNKSENDNLILDESFSANEIIYLAKQQNTNEKISFINKILISGRAERALIDATNLKKKILFENNKSAKLDAIISSAALRLTRWDELEMISYEYEIPQTQRNFDINFYLNSNNYSNVDVDSLIDISTGKLLYFLKTNKFTNFSNELNIIRSLLSLKLTAVSMMTSYHRLISILAQFRTLEEVEDFYNQKYVLKDINKRFVFGDWVKQTELSVDDVEFATSVRCALISIESGILNNDQEEYTNDFSSQWLNLSKMCRKSESLFRAEMFCSRARYSTTSTETCNFEFAKIAYAKNKKDQAISLIKSIQNQISSTIESMTNNKNNMNQDNNIFNVDKANDLRELYGKIIYIRAKWSEEMNSEDSSSIIDMYQKSIQFQEKGIKKEDQNMLSKNKIKNKSEKQRNAFLGAAKAYLSLGALADQRATSYIQYITETNELAQQKKSPRPGKFWNQFTANEMKEFLLQMITGALDNYLLCIIYSPQYSYEVVPRILFLFFDIGRYFITDDDDKKGITNLSQNQKLAILTAMRESMLKKMEKVRAGVWLNAITQLISRIDQPKSLEDVLFKLIRLSVLEYPESSLWHLISIKHSTVSNRKPKWDIIMEYTKRDLPRDFAQKLEATTNNLASIAHHIIDLCQTTIGSSKSKTTKSSHMCPKLVSDLKDCRVLMPLLSTLTTTNFDSPNSLSRVEIVEMGPKIELFSSLQKPRKVEFKGSDGIYYHYLCKKDEDLRKDMRMMEFASFINRILTNDRRCRQKDLRIVTYAVICLNEYCGMMEWVENTKSFRTVVSKMLKFMGIEINFNEVKKYYIEVDKPNQEQLQQRTVNFKNILLKKFPPVLHAWFTYHFKDISSWFNSRLLYTRSTALWSMVGYIVGLGDRHAENILLNTKTGSCVHVDFNLMFDRAKTLAVPEIVPFRLTQNIVDGMGAMGTDGPFTETSILVMETFRAKKVKLISVLQTFNNDPLIEWRKGSKAATESTAKMTLKEVERRITGTDEARSTTLSSECVVKELIKQASDIRNLVLMFIGWQSYL